MSLASPLIFDGSAARPMLPGDLINSNELVQTDATAAAITWSTKQVMGSILSRSGPGAGYADVTPTATDWVNAMLQQSYIGGGAISPLGVQVGTTYRFRVLSTVAFANTIVAGTNVTLAGVTAVAASSYRDYLVTVLNGTPAQLFACTTTNGSAVVTGMTAAQTALITQGMAVSGAGVAAGATILSVQPGVGFTMSANATATGVLVAVTFAPRLELRGIGGGLI
jgi:hypothetical protein